MVGGSKIHTFLVLHNGTTLGKLLNWPESTMAQLRNTFLSTNKFTTMQVRLENLYFLEDLIHIERSNIPEKNLPGLLIRSNQCVAKVLF